MTLSWSVTAGDVLSINNGGGAVSGTTGRVTVLPSIATTYILTDDDSDGLSNALEYALGGANGSNNPINSGT